MACHARLAGEAAVGGVDVIDVTGRTTPPPPRWPGSGKPPPPQPAPMPPPPPPPHKAPRTPTPAKRTEPAARWGQRGAVGEWVE